jgi:hypothetical protein
MNTKWASCLCLPVSFTSKIAGIDLKFGVGVYTESFQANLIVLMFLLFNPSSIQSLDQASSVFSETSCHTKEIFCTGITFRFYQHVQLSFEIFF